LLNSISTSTIPQTALILFTRSSLVAYGPRRKGNLVKYQGPIFFPVQSDCGARVRGLVQYREDIGGDFS
jgi:hypothetical protein